MNNFESWYDSHKKVSYKREQFFFCMSGCVTTKCDQNPVAGNGNFAFSACDLLNHQKKKNSISLSQFNFCGIATRELRLIRNEKAIL